MADPVTLKDVAAAAGVHVSTASRALNPETRSVVNVDTAGRVLEVAERLGYRPHPLARGLRTNRTLTIGMVVPDLMNPLFPPIYAGADAVLGDLGYSVLVSSDDDDPAKGRSVVVALMERRVDGLILANAHRDLVIPTRHSKVPTVLVNRSSASNEFPAIVGDDHAGVGLVVGHLVSLGHTAIAHVAGSQDLSTGLARRQAFVEWTNREGLDGHPELIVEAGAFRTEEGRAACDRLLDSGEDFTAIVAANDLIALGCYDALAQRGISVPGDVSVTGYNDMTFVDRVAPPLTTVAVPYQEMGGAAARQLLDLLVGEVRAGAPYPPTRLAPELVVRESTAPPPEAKRS
ncbi:MAG: LacI family DNA-binding transcriptional regulator [Actinobacteria bacterium]|nr:LacI family DNA-binding transcriptional regulator [Actinomycetota bacterium]